MLLSLGARRWESSQDQILVVVAVSVGEGRIALHHRCRAAVAAVLADQEGGAGVRARGLEFLSRGTRQRKSVGVELSGGASANAELAVVLGVALGALNGAAFAACGLDEVGGASRVGGRTSSEG